MYSFNIVVPHVGRQNPFCQATICMVTYLCRSILSKWVLKLWQQNWTWTLDMDEQPPWSDRCFVVVGVAWNFRLSALFCCQFCLEKSSCVSGFFACCERLGDSYLRYLWRFKSLKIISKKSRSSQISPAMKGNMNQIMVSWCRKINSTKFGPWKKSSTETFLPWQSLGFERATSKGPSPNISTSEAGILCRCPCKNLDELIPHGHRWGYKSIITSSVKLK